jgi:hypothetical protein
MLQRAPDVKHREIGAERFRISEIDRVKLVLTIYLVAGMNQEMIEVFGSR